MTTPPALEEREGLPDALRVLLEAFPRENWNDDTLDDLTKFWLQRHMMFRRLLGHMADDAKRLSDGVMDPEKYIAHLSRLGSHFVQDLHAHHHIEDEAYFPKLIKSDPRLERGFDMLDADHKAIDGHLNTFVEAANGLIQASPDARAQMGAPFADHIEGLQQLLHRHLTDEEDLVVPVILKYGPPEH
ncbi:MAG: hemerythrin domain-containing protein [Pseudomonadota bacterium]